MFGKKTNLEDLYTLDKNLYKNLMSIRDYDGDVTDLCLTFSITIEDGLGNHNEINLIPNGKNIEVTNNNKMTYIYKYSQYLLETQFKSLNSYFKRGFYNIFNNNLIRLFNVTEFITILSGEDSDINVQDWMLHTIYEKPYSKNSRVIKNFWNIVKNMDNKTKKKLLQFATSNSRPPINGFKDLNPKFTIRPIYIDVNVSVSSTFKSIFSKKPTKDPLPSSATCFNMLKLPMYSNKKIMKQKLYKCIQEAKGFHIA